MRPYTRRIQLLPNKRAGYILDCINPKAQIIQEINPTTDLSSDIYVEKSITYLGNFCYYKDMKGLILVDVNGLYLKSTLYGAGANGKRTNITPEFQRADFPACSPTENIIAFLGTKPYSGSNDPKNWRQIENLFDYPWNLYLYNPDSQKTEELPIEIVHPGRL